MCLALVTLGMIVAALAPTPEVLGAGRFITGLGAGGLVASLPVLIAEYTPARRRDTAIAVYTSGLPLGGVIGGLTAAAFGSHGWRLLFEVGAGLSAALFVIALLLMPESLSYLTQRGGARALSAMNRILPRIGQPTVDRLPDRAERPGGAVAQDLFRGGNWIKTTVLWLAIFVMMLGFYFATSWMPVLLAQSGLSAKQGVSGGLLLNIGGVVGTLVYGLLAALIDRRRLTTSAFVIVAASFFVISLLLGSSLGVLLAAALVVGFVINLAATGMFAILPDMYPAATRATGVGWALTCGRIGAIASPLIVGALMGAGWRPGALFILFAVPTLVAGIVLAMMLARFGSQMSRPGAAQIPAGATQTGSETLSPQPDSDFSRPTAEGELL